MTDLDEFLPSIMPYAPGCPEPTAFAAIITAAQQFCRRTRLWRDEDSFELTGDGCNVVCTPEGADMFEIESASVEGYPLTPIPYARLNRQFPNWREQDGNARYISQVSPDSVVVAPGAASGTLLLSIFLRPSNSAEQLPDFLATHYLREIADGALGEILMLPAQSFTDPERAQFYAMRFSQRLDTLSTGNIQGQQRAPARTRPNYF